MRMAFLGLSLAFVTVASGCTFADDDAPVIARGMDVKDAPSDDGTTTPPNDAPMTDRATIGVLSELSVMKLEFPEGLAVRNGEAFVGLAPKYRVDRVDGSGKLVPFASFPDGGFDNASGVIGTAFDAKGRLYAAVISHSNKITNGIYRTSENGGEAQLFSSAPELVHPNGLAFSADGTLYFSDSATGSVWSASHNGTTTKVASGSLLEGDTKTCPDAQPKRDTRYGANGLVVIAGGLYVVNSEKATVSKVTLMGANRGNVETVYGPDCANLYGADGIVLDRDDSLLVAAQWSKKIVRVRPSSTGARADVIAEDPSMTAPASIAWRDATKRELIVTNFPIDDALALRNPEPSVLVARFPR